MFDRSIVLNNGVKIPQLGLGTWFIDDDKAADAVKSSSKRLDIDILILHRHIIMKKEWVMQSGNAVYHVKNCLSQRKYGISNGGYEKAKSFY